VSVGIQTTESWLRVDARGRPRLTFFDLPPVGGRDESLVGKGLPASTIEEFPAYVWDTREGRSRGEAPMKECDHGMDAMRYLVMARDTRHNRLRVV
jgi:hypothetical protein